MRTVPAPPASNILSTDPGLASVGYVLSRLWTRTSIAPLVEAYEAGVWKADLPEADAREKSVVEESFSRARVQAENVRRVVQASGVSVLVTEALSHPRDAGSAAKVSMFWGALAAVTDELGLHVEMVRPQDVRKALNLPKTTRAMTRVQKKKLVHDALSERYGAVAMKRLLGHLTRAEDRTHPTDALATLTAALVLQFGDSVEIRIA